MTTKHVQEVSGDCEPGASLETMLVTTDSFEQIEQEMSSSYDDRHMKESTTSTISEIQDGILSDNPDIVTPSDVDELTAQFKDGTIDENLIGNSDDDYLQNSEWINQSKHIFVLSSAGKPIYSRYCKEYVFKRFTIIYIDLLVDMEMRINWSLLMVLCKCWLVLFKLNRMS